MSAPERDEWNEGALFRSHFVAKRLAIVSIVCSWSIVDRAAKKSSTLTKQPKKSSNRRVFIIVVNDVWSLEWRPKRLVLFTLTEWFRRWFVHELNLNRKLLRHLAYWLAASSVMIFISRRMWCVWKILVFLHSLDTHFIGLFFIFFPHFVFSSSGFFSSLFHSLAFLLNAYAFLILFFRFFLFPVYFKLSFVGLFHVFCVV